MESEHSIDRVQSVALENFRGFGERRTINTDAEIVLLEGPNGYGKTSFLDALCILLNGTAYHDQETWNFHGANSGPNLDIEYTNAVSDSVLSQTLKIIKNGSKKIFVSFEPEGLPWWPKKEIRESRILVRSSFFYEDMIDKMLETNGGLSVREFLLPTLPVMDEIGAKLILLNGRWAKETNRYLQDAGIMSETDKNARRKQVISEFLNAWDSLFRLESVKTLSLNQEYTTAFLINNDNLRKTWRSELQNFVANLYDVLDMVGSMPTWKRDSNPVEVLSFLAQLILQFKTKVVTQSTKEHSNREELVRMLTQEDSQFDEEAMMIMDDASAGEPELKRFEQELAALSAEADQFANLRHQFRPSNPQNADLAEILQSLQNNAATWLEVSQISTSVPLPDGLIDWLADTVKTLRSEWSDLLREWEKKVNEEYYKLIQRREKVRGLVIKRKGLLEISSKIREFIAIDPALRAYIEVQTFENGRIKLDSVKKFLNKEMTDSTNDPVKVQRVDDMFNQLQAAVQRWTDLEKTINQNEEKEKLSQAGQYASKIADMLERESGQSKKRSSHPLWKEGFDILPSEKEALEQRMRDVLARFRLVEGVESFQLSFVTGRNNEPDIKLVSKDGRPFSMLSTGQKAQVILSLMLALNYSFSDIFKHKVVAIDDVTTPFDMSQMARFAILLRQMAYANRGGANARQVFVVSHHEEMSDRLVEFLVPPKGCKLRIVKFVGWSKEKGPEISEFDIRPSAEIIDKSRHEFAKFLTRSTDVGNLAAW